MNKKIEIEYFESAHDRSIYDLGQLKLELLKKLERLKINANKHQDIYITFKVKGYEYEARSFEDIQDLYGTGEISTKKLDKLAEDLENKKKYLKHTVQISQLEEEIRMLSCVIREIKEAKENKWPLC